MKILQTEITPAHNSHISIVERNEPYFKSPFHYHPEIELDEGEAEMGFYDGAGIELKDVLREQVLLSLPMQLVCSEDCKGICSQCGKNKNTGLCQCEARPADDRWAALRNLKAETEARN